jgi:phospholipid/cholesterol/gamma-HCH transport system substrate-binding protein
VQRLLSDETLQSVSASTSELHSLLRELNATASEQRAELGVLSKSLRHSARGLERVTTRPELLRSIERADAAMLQLQHVTASLDRSSRSLEVVIGRLERGEGSLGKLLKDEELHRNLNDTLVTANRLMADVRARPGRYVQFSVF